MRQLQSRISVVLAALALASSLSPRAARAAEPAAAAPAADDAKAQARSKYVEGVGFVQKTQWSDALAAFEASAKLYSSPATTLNIGACERALGRYVRARATLLRAVEESKTAPNPLPQSSLDEAKGFVAEIDGVLARAKVTVQPAEAAIAIDGRPLVAQPAEHGRTVLAAGVAPPAPGTPPPTASFDLVLDPGVHVLTLSRKGFTDVVVNRTFAPGSSSTLDLKLDLLPATLKVTSTQAGALVRVDGADVGPVPVDVLRPAGSHRVLVQQKGFVAYDTQVTVQPGEQVKLRAELAVHKPSIATRWWFWTGVAVVVGAGVAITYAATRPTPEPPPYDGGSTGWVVQGLRY